MRHRKRGRKLGRNSSHRKALLKNMALSLIEHERIITTREKAKFVQPFVEKLITLSKKKTDHNQKLVFSRIQGAQRIRRSLDEKGQMIFDPSEGRKGEIAEGTKQLPTTSQTSSFGRRNRRENPEEQREAAERRAKPKFPERRDRRMIKKLFDEIGPRFKDRPGGYTRILRLAKNRLGDNASQVIFELVEGPGGEAEENAAE